MKAKALSFCRVSVVVRGRRPYGAMPVRGTVQTSGQGIQCLDGFVGLYGCLLRK